ncbi:hypothetical protein OIDMADRAFT_169797 [Oidiodendron maius Zn]|uniref:Heterokaryon incompatibility domain-containing protein n=1 Tax=Oidiodendron maius (strain Zn) TaxID=913774 RepID=A0A0C3CDK6_OIDMZ|nr:hypothetical protein OIDMADRAFT_169797 [Oidiodendron maius Zn]
MDADEPTVSPGSINLNLILRWKRTCEATHGAVCNTRNSDYMTRQLQTINLVDVETLSLVTTSTSTKFVALSYVWGSVPMFKTQTSTIHLLRTPGSLSSTNSNLIIPATIRDAIYLTRKLGEKYLWVDCLCIVQDADSMEQSLKAMAAIYASAEFTIVDAAGQNANYGLEVIRSTSQHHILPDNRGAGNRLTTCQEQRDGYPWASTWDSRGWTFQESLFSRRLLVFDGVMSWVCGRCIWLEEAGDLFFPQILEEKAIGWPLERDHLGIPVGLMSILPKLPDLGCWGNLVENFSMRELTYERDIVNAFAGATEITSSTFPGRIFKGLPVFFFDIAILWQPDEAISRRSSDNDHKFPSWSWTGWKGSISCLASWGPFQAGLYRSSGHRSDWVSVVQLRPVAKWYKISSLEISHVIPIQSDFYRYQAFRDRVDEDLPAGWCRHEHTDGAYFTTQEHMPGFRYGYSLPIRTHPELNCNDEFGHILWCTASRALACFGEIKEDIWSRPLIELVASTGQIIGSLRLHSLGEMSTTKGDICELIAISLGELKDHERVQGELSRESPSEWAIGEWEMSAGGYDIFYNVMWIGWNEDVACRKGLGKVGKEAWSCMQPSLTSFKLG